MNACRICKNENCDDDCEELSLIFRQSQKEKLRDIEVDDMVECLDCGRPCEASENFCYSCVNVSYIYDDGDDD